MKCGDRVQENGRYGVLVAFQPQKMADVRFDDMRYPIRRPRANLRAARAGMRTQMNPKKGPVEVWDPEKEQLRATVQGIYESQVRKALGHASKTPFSSLNGARLDDVLSPEHKRDLLSTAFAIATKQGQRHGFLVPGTQTPTAKGVRRSYERLQDTAKAAQNRADLELTLAHARKGCFFRVVSESEHVHKVQPSPNAYIHVPPYRCTAGAALKDAERAEAARQRYQAQSARMNPRGSFRFRRNPDDDSPEARAEREAEAFLLLSPAQAEAEILRTVQRLRLYEQQLNEAAAREGRATPVAMPEKAFTFLKAKLSARTDLSVRTVAEAMQLADELPYSVPTGTLGIQEHFYGTDVNPGPIRRLPGWYVAANQWKNLEHLLTKDAIKSATEGSKQGGVAGSGKAQANSYNDQVKFDEMLQELNRAAHKSGRDGVSLIEQVRVYLASLPENRIPRVRPVVPAGMALPPKNTWPLMQAEDFRITQELFESKVQAITGVKGMGDSARAEEAPVAGKTERQELALEKQAIRREEAKARKASLTLSDRPFYDVERTVLLYRVEQGIDLTPRKKYYTYVLDPKETLEDVIKKEGFVPALNAAGVPEMPTIETRYVIYIPRKPRFVAIQERTGGVAVLAPQNTRGAVRAPKGMGLSEELLPEQERRPKRRVRGYEETGLISDKSFKVWPSMILTRFFHVSPEGMGGKAGEAACLETAAKAPESTGALEFTLDNIGTAQDSARLDIDLDTFAAVFREQHKGRGTPRPQKKTFLSPDSNWVRYKLASSVYKRMRQGTWNDVTRTFEGGIRDFPQYDVFYTLSAPLAYLTIMYFNTPQLLGHVDTELASVRDVLEAMPDRPGQVHGMDILSMAPHALLAQIRLTPEILRNTLSLQNRGLLPVLPRPDLSVTQAQFHRTGLGLILGARTEEDVARSQLRTSRSALEMRAMEDRQAAVRQAREIEVPRRKLGLKPLPPEVRPTALPVPAPAPRPSEVPTDRDRLEVDLDSLLGFNNNPYRRRR